MSCRHDLLLHRVRHDNSEGGGVVKEGVTRRRADADEIVGHCDRMWTLRNFGGRVMWQISNFVN